MKTLARRHTVLTFLLINFAWTWLFWLAAIPFRARNDLLVMSLVMIGGYGPALAGILTLRLKSDAKPGTPVKQWLVMGMAAAIIFGVMALRYRAGNIPGYDVLAANLTLSTPIVAAAAVASLAGGWMVSSAVSRHPDVRARMASMLPRRADGWTLLGLAFYPTMILVAWGLAALLGLGVEVPALWGRPAVEVLPLYALTFALVALAQGGNEEPGWRGLMQPELQKRFSPLVAALIVSFFWSLWHLPLYLNGFYGGPLVGGMIGSGIYRILLAIFMAWFYNRSGGNLFSMIFLHTCFNILVNFLPTSDLGLTLLWLVVVVAVVIKDKMYRKSHTDGPQVTGMDVRVPQQGQAGGRQALQSHLN